ncbi:MAG TPA: invasion associated locus B family protein [Aliidongia sp.]|nr:invasion associated locus B family protein [Aliidongia sp.]
MNTVLAIAGLTLLALAQPVGPAQAAIGPAATPPEPPETPPGAVEGPRFTVQTFGGWTYRCREPYVDGKPDRAQCELAQDVFVTKDDKPVPVMAIAFGRDPDLKGHVVTVRVPLGVRLKPGLSVAADGGTPFVLPFDFCGERGCWVSNAAGDALLQALKPGKTGRVKLTLVNGRDLTIEFSLTGLAAAVAALDSATKPAGKAKGN